MLPSKTHFFFPAVFQGRNGKATDNRIKGEGIDTRAIKGMVITGEVENTNLQPAMLKGSQVYVNKE